MLENFKRWLGKDAQGSQWVEPARWAKKQGYQFKRTKEDEGFVLDGNAAGHHWRLEWGPSQRTYIAPHELRLRMELHLPASLQMLIMGRALMEQLESETFDRYTETMQTQIDVATPEEMRWLAMFPKINLGLPREARAFYAAVSIDALAFSSWLDLALSERLVQATQGFLSTQPPFVLMLLRGRIYLRLKLDQPDTSVMGDAIRVLEAAAQSALRLNAQKDEGSEWQSSAPTAWQTQPAPDNTPPRRGGG
jgi:hypothetical protein